MDEHNNTKTPNNTNNSKQLDILVLFEKKILFFKELLQKTFLYIKKNKALNILAIDDVNNYIKSITEINDKINDLNLLLKKNAAITTSETDIIINNLQTINNELSKLLKTCGSESLEDLLSICFGTTISLSLTSYEDIHKYELLKKYLHPIGYKIFSDNKNDKSMANEINLKMFIPDDTFLLNAKTLDCFDISLNPKQFYLNVHGIKLIIHIKSTNKKLIIQGVVDDINLDFLKNEYIASINSNIDKIVAKNDNFKNEFFPVFMNSLTLKDYLINNPNEICEKFVGYSTQHTLLKEKTLFQITKEFILHDLFLKRQKLIQLLLFSNTAFNDTKIIAYLLYDIISNDLNGNVDTSDQIAIFDSFPNSIKSLFHDAMKKTMQYTSDLSTFDINKIPYEQQICLLKVDSSVKEKAMAKLKEVKSKSEDSGSKAKQYLDGLLKIPFNIYKKEIIMNIMKLTRDNFLKMANGKEIKKLFSDIPIKNSYTSLEIIKHTSSIKKKLNDIVKTNNGSGLIDNNKDIILSDYNQKFVDKINKLLINEKNFLKLVALKTNELIDIQKLSFDKIDKNANKTFLKKKIFEILEYCFKEKKIDALNTIIDNIVTTYNDAKKEDPKPSKKYIPETLKLVQKIEDNFTTIKSYMSNVRTILNKSVYGHEKAKTQIERIIAQWINGEQTGYCFGFEGPPGVGKTSLAKNGLSHCLLDEHGESRPFSILQIAGDSNGSTLHGHNYTYVGSTWGTIVQILMDKKCMNPIIFIDEVDKISKTENGKEIIGVLTHLLDPVQNDCYQDKYFNGINIDVSKVLFILSYNEPELIDKILLDRVHRIKFNNLSIEEKVEICNLHLLPEIYKKMGLENIFQFDNDVLKHIIEFYTYESGVRKLKEILFEIVGEINLDILKTNNLNYQIPIVITINDVKNKYLKSRQTVRVKQINSNSQVGVINALWANSQGQCGILPINGKFFPSKEFLELKLTGLLDQMMSESFNVAQTLAWELTDEENRNELLSNYNGDNKYSIHIHTGDGSINKSGTSAGIALTILIYSLFNNRKINNTFGVTGEADLHGNANEIGGLNLKILGGIKAGIKSFIYPQENQKDYLEFMEKYKNNDIIKGIDFFPISHVSEAFNLIFTD
jgi:ATP-dependent Lon protease